MDEERGQQRGLGAGHPGEQRDQLDVPSSEQRGLVRVDLVGEGGADPRGEVARVPVRASERLQHPMPARVEAVAVDRGVEGGDRGHAGSRVGLHA
ncbi:MAG: hypothetical protein ABMB14_23690 [Myxococcota bacterium]